MGLTGVGDELTEQEKILARYQLVLEATKNAQGDVARTPDSTSNQMRRAAAAFEDLRVAIGMKLLPVVTHMIENLASILDYFARLPSAAHTAIDALTGSAPPSTPDPFRIGTRVPAIRPPPPSP